MGKIISALSVAAAFAAATASYFAAIKPIYGQVALLVAAAAAAAGGALSKVTDNLAMTFLGVIVAVSSAALGYADMLPPAVVQILGILSVGLAAAGRSLFGDVFGEQKK